jgi:hypothetical protein
MFTAQQRQAVFGEANLRFQPVKSWECPEPQHYIVSQQALASLIGTMAVLLPTALVMSWLFLDVDLRWSISHYYYVPFLGDVFVGTLVFVGAVMIAFKGESWYEWWLSLASGLCALVVATFPCNRSGHGPGAFSARVLAEMSPGSGTGEWIAAPRLADHSFFSLFPGCRAIHFGAAITLFAILATFCFLAFTRVVKGRHRAGGTEDGPLSRNKRIRNVVYLAMGSVIVLAMLFAGFMKWRYPAVCDGLKLFFWSECAMLWAFGTAWIVKGRCWGLLLRDAEDPGLLTPPLRPRNAPDPEPEPRP